MPPAIQPYAIASMLRPIREVRDVVAESVQDDETCGPIAIRVRIDDERVHGFRHADRHAMPDLVPLAPGARRSDGAVAEMQAAIFAVGSPVGEAPMILQFLLGGILAPETGSTLDLLVTDALLAPVLPVSGLLTVSAQADRVANGPHSTWRHDDIPALLDPLPIHRTDPEPLAWPMVLFGQSETGHQAIARGRHLDAALPALAAATFDRTVRLLPTIVINDRRGLR